MGDSDFNLQEMSEFLNENSDGHRLAEFLQKKSGRRQPRRIFDEESERFSLEVRLEKKLQTPPAAAEDVPEKEASPQSPTQAPDESRSENEEAGRPDAANVPAVVGSPPASNPPSSAVKRLSAQRTNPSDRLRRLSLKRLASFSSRKRSLLSEFESINSLQFSPGVCSTPVSARRPLHTHKDGECPLNEDCPSLVQQEVAAGTEIPSSEAFICNLQRVNDDLADMLQGGVEASNNNNTGKENLSRAVDRENTTTGGTARPATPGRSYIVERGASPGQVLLTPACSPQKTPVVSTKPRIEVKDISILMPPQSQCAGSEIPSTPISTQQQQQPKSTPQMDVEIPATQHISKETLELLQSFGKPPYPCVVVPVHQTFNVPPAATPFDNLTRTIVRDDSPTIANKSPQRQSPRKSQTPKPTSPAKTAQESRSTKSLDEKSTRQSSRKTVTPTPPMPIKSPSPPKPTSPAKTAQESRSTKSLDEKSTRQSSRKTVTQTPPMPVKSPSPPKRSKLSINKSAGTYEITPKTIHPPPHPHQLLPVDKEDDELCPTVIITDDESSAQDSGVPLNLAAANTKNLRKRRLRTRSNSQRHLPSPGLSTETETDTAPSRAQNKRSHSSRRTNVPLNKAPSTPINGEKFASELGRLSYRQILDLRKRNSQGKVYATPKSKSRQKAAKEHQQVVEQRLLLQQQIEIELLRREVEGDNAVLEETPAVEEEDDQDVIYVSPSSSLLGERSCDRVSFLPPQSFNTTANRSKRRKCKPKMPELVRKYIDVPKSIRRNKRNRLDQSKRSLYSKGMSEEESTLRGTPEVLSSKRRSNRSATVAPPPAFTNSPIRDLRIASPPPPRTPTKGKKHARRSERREATSTSPLPPPEPFSDQENLVAPAAKAATTRPDEERIFKVPTALKKGVRRSRRKDDTPTSPLPPPEPFSDQENVVAPAGKDITTATVSAATSSEEEEIFKVPATMKKGVRRSRRKDDTPTSPLPPPEPFSDQENQATQSTKDITKTAMTAPTITSDDAIFKVPQIPAPRRYKKKSQPVVQEPVEDCNQTLRRSKRARVQLSDKPSLFQILYEKVLQKTLGKKEKELERKAHKQSVQLASSDESLPIASSTANSHRKATNRQKKASDCRPNGVPYSLLGDTNASSTSTSSASSVAPRRRDLSPIYEPVEDEALHEPTIVESDRAAPKRGAGRKPRTAKEAPKTKTVKSRTNLERDRLNMTPAPIEGINEIFDHLKEASRQVSPSSKPVATTECKTRRMCVRVKRVDSNKESAETDKSDNRKTNKQPETVETVKSDNRKKNKQPETAATDKSDNKQKKNQPENAAQPNISTVACTNPNLELKTWLKGVASVESGQLPVHTQIYDEMRHSAGGNLLFTDIDGVDYAFYDTNDKASVGYLRFKPLQQKPARRAKMFNLHFIVLAGTFKISTNKDEGNFTMGDLVAINRGARYALENCSDDIGILMVIKK